MVLVLAVVLVSYCCGGYVAGRMARFDGIRQGLAVLGWAVVAADVAAVVLLGVVLTALVGAVLGGLAGMHFHRRVDRAGLGR